MTRQQQAVDAIITADRIENWMITADTQEDRARTAHAIRNAATEALEELSAVQKRYPAWDLLPLSEIRAMHSAMKNVLKWCATTIN